MTECPQKHLGGSFLYYLFANYYRYRLSLRSHQGVWGGAGPLTLSTPVAPTPRALCTSEDSKRFSRMATHAKLISYSYSSSHIHVEGHSYNHRLKNLTQGWFFFKCENAPTLVWGKHKFRDWRVVTGLLYVSLHSFQPIHDQLKTDLDSSNSTSEK